MILEIKIIGILKILKKTIFRCSQAKSIVIFINSACSEILLACVNIELVILCSVRFQAGSAHSIKFLSLTRVHLQNKTVIPKKKFFSGNTSR